MALENNLNRSIAKMSKASLCAAHIYTRGNKEMINFVASRFKLIQKQKTGSHWTGVTAKKPEVASLNKAANVPLVMDKPAFIKPQPTAATPKYPVVQITKRAPTSSTQPQGALGQTKMVLSQDVYAALWDEVKPRPQLNAQRKAIKKLSVDYSARHAQLAQQRQDKHRKQVLIQQQKARLVNAKRRAMQHHLSQQRLARQRLLKRRALARALNRKRVQQRKVAMAKRRSR